MQASTTLSPSVPTQMVVPEFGMRGQYQIAGTSMTLREGLAEYYRVNPGLADPAQIDDVASATFFHNHDCTHVVFGTHTGILDEGVNDMWTLFGADIRLRDYFKAYISTEESKSINKEFLKWSVFSLFWRTLRLTPKVWRHTRAMTRKWPWTPPPELMDRPLREIRELYGIEVFRPNVALGLED
ncbi:hypothetical protein [Enhygromyxa salina]|uniref:Uncharacterized protein n=1 Tax=Enhygromyxa salina TaxID=215803 RepID=A0A2S9YF82_9BACT|nr:hypothetical protein [Enhygromyxa salina]PRQ03775.1 hypothetical protein ENSA7_52420 [Enhygromyxa salina]